MPLALTCQVSEADYDPLFGIQYNANLDDPVLPALFPGGLDPAVRAQNVAAFKAILGWTDPQVKAAEVVDDQTGQICAFATMRIHDQNPFMGAVHHDVQLPHRRRERGSMSNGHSTRRREGDWASRSYRCRDLFVVSLVLPPEVPREARSHAPTDLQAVSTDPARQREGAATLLLNWAVDVADSKYSRMILDASSVAVKYGLYEKHGFRAIDTHTYVDKERFPTEPPSTLVTMLREARQR